MTKISIYNKDTDVRGNDKWIGSDAQNQNRTKNFTPDNVAAYFNENQVIDLGVELRYFYDTLDPLQERVYGSITFETEIGPQVNFSSISTFILSKYTMGHTDVSQFLDFLIGSNVLLSRSNNINMFGYYKIDNIEPYLPDPNFFVVTLTFENGNGYMKEDEDYFISLVQFEQTIPDVPTRTSDLINDGQDGVHPFITAEDVPTPTLQSVTDQGDTTTTTVYLNGGAISESINEQAVFAPAQVSTVNLNSGSGATLDSTGKLALSPNGLVSSLFAADNITQSITLQSPNKAPGSYTLATTDDIPAVTGFVPYTGANQNVNLGEYELKAGQLTLDTTPTGTSVVGTTQWNDTTGVSETKLKGGNVVLKNGVDLVARVVNKVTPNATLLRANYTAVRISGAQGQRLAVAYAQANNDNNSADTLGLVYEDIATNQEGFIMTMGQFEEINTTGSLQGETWTDGDVLYLSPTTAGRLTNIKPTGLTGHIVVMGYVEYAHAIHGKIYVKIMNGWELDELHNVYINSPLNNDGLFYDSADSLWKNKTIAAALGYTPENVANKSTSTSLGTSDTLYPTQNAVKVYADTKFTLPALTSGSVLFSNGTTIAQDNSNLFWDDTNNRLGIGTNAPSVSLDLNANYTFNTGIGRILNIKANSGPTVIAGFGTGMNFGLKIGSGAVEDVAYIDVLNTQTFRSGDISFKVSQGSSPTEAMRINYLGNILLGTSTNAGFKLDVNGTARVSGNATFGTLGTGTGMFWDNTNNRLGIGTASPAAKTSIVSTTALTGLYVENLGSATTPSAVFKNNQNSSYASIDVIGGSLITNATKFQFGQYSGGDAFFFLVGNNNLDFFTNSVNRIRIFGGGNVAIGTTTDAGFKLDVNGTARVSGELTVNGVNIGLGGGAITTNTRVGSNAGLSNTTGYSNSFFGRSAGQSNTTGNSNSFFGQSAGLNTTTATNNSFFGVNVGLSNTTGSNNSFFGVNAGFNNTTGNSNSFFGLNAGFNNTTGGSSNSFFGVNAGQSNTTGSSNSFFGQSAGLNTTIGSNNSFVGTSAGRYIADGITNLTAVDNSVFLGNNTRANTNSETNQIVIGYQAIGIGSNSVVLGNDSITKTALKGNVLINTTTDAGFRLDVNGTARVTGLITANGGVLIGGSGGVGGVFVQSGSPANRETIVIRGSLLTTDIGTDVVFTNGQGNAANLSGIRNITEISRGFNPTSGTGVFNSMLISATINQTGGANGITRGLYINPTLTAAADFRAIETTAGNVLFGASGTGFFWDNTNNGLTLGGTTLDSNIIFQINGSKGARISGTGAGFGYSLVRGSETSSFANSASAGVLSSTNTLIFNTAATIRVLINSSGNVLINTTTDIASSKLTIESTTQGFLPPRMTTTQKNAIATPAAGLVVYDTTLGKLCVRTAAAWETITSV